MGKGRSGEANHMWKGGRSVASNGYVLIRVGADHHLADVRGYAYEHRLVAEQKLGRQLGPDDVIHHINENKQDNRPENLEVTDRRLHRVYHRSKESRLQLPGEDNPLVPCACGCGEKVPKFDETGRPRLFVQGHNSKFQPSPTIDHILGELESGPKNLDELTRGFNGTKRTLRAACSKLAKGGVIIRLRRGIYTQRR